MCNKYMQRSTDVYELPTTRDMKQVSHFKDLVSIGPFTLEYLFFFSYRKKACKTLQTGCSGKKKSKCVPMAHFSISFQTCLTQELVSQQATMKSSGILPMDSRFLPFSFLMIMEGYLSTVLLLPQKPSAVSCSLFQF